MSRTPSKHPMGFDLRPEAAEALGVFFLVLAGGGAILAGGNAIAVALAFGLVVAVLVYALGHVCGAHFNPAITLAFALTRHFPWRRVAGYVAAQVVGAVAASLLLAALHGDISVVATVPKVALWRTLLVEALATFLLAFVIIAVATDRRAASGLAGLAIGLVVTVNVLWAGPLTDAGTNPARTLGPALVGLEWGALWAYLVAPAAGACLAMLAYEALRGGSKPAAGEALGALGPVKLSKGAKE